MIYSAIKKGSPQSGLPINTLLKYIVVMDYVLSRIWKLKRPRNDDDDDVVYIIGSIIAFVAIVVGYAYHVGF
jgi:hypothetical protein